jgi:mannose-6-phosphate isomerase-like protein (cupin superfamily)
MTSTAWDTQENDGETALQIIAVTVPSCPGEGEAFPVAGIWEAAI